jgi:hypothetical protein
MNEGWVINQGAFYIKDEAVALEFAKGHGWASIQELYDACQDDDGNSDAFYWTEWEELDEDQWYESPYEDGREAVLVSAE